ncbi:MAG: ParA family protein [Oscillospiraceae bacterium]|nr:ParA family protein [Oscillospiraceae bacterium]
MIITIAAQKGGVSKTTSAASIAQAMASRGKRSLLVDLDPQRSASLIYGASERTGGSYNLIKGAQAPEDLIEHTACGDIIPASVNLAILDIELAGNNERDYLLKRALSPILEKYDCVICDTPPGYGTCLIQALTAADKVLIPLICDPHAVQGLYQITETISDVRRLVNPELEISGVVLTQHQGRTILTRQYEQLIRRRCEELGIRYAETHIRKAIALQEAQALRESLYTYAPKSKPAQDYMALIDELGL